MNEYETQGLWTADPSAVLQNQAYLFQAVDFFPLPIAIFQPNGVSAHLNNAFLEYFSIADPAMIVAKLNILDDPFANHELGLKDYLRRVFAGEILTFFDIKVPFDEVNKRYAPDKNRFSSSDIYQDIISFPVWDAHDSIAFIIIVFKTRRIYQEQNDILKAKEFIEKHSLEEYDMHLIADAVGLSQYHFARLFKKHAGMTPYRFYQTIKIQKLKDALRDTKLSIAQVFASCGADYSGSYAKIFKDKVGMTPSQYRQAVLANTCLIQSQEQDECGIGVWTNQSDTCNLASLRSDDAKEELLFQIAELFPIPIQVFKPDGDIVFINQAVLKMWNVSESAQILGNYNLIKDPFVNDQSGLREYIRRSFQGEVVLIPDIRVPLEDFWAWYKTRSAVYDIESIYTDILNFPIFDAGREMTHIMSVFFTSRIYRGKSDIARAKEYIENHWLEEFDLDKISEASHLSRYHFTRLFKKHTGMTPYNYYKELKVDKLKKALRDKNLTVTEAFTSCGIAYSGHFAGLFKEKVGMTPSQYRKTMKY